MLALESEVAVLTNKPAPAETRAEAARIKNKPEVAISELKLMSINDYMANKGRSVPMIPFAINVLLD